MIYKLLDAESIKRSKMKTFHYNILCFQGPNFMIKLVIEKYIKLNVIGTPGWKNVYKWHYCLNSINMSRTIIMFSGNMEPYVVK